MKGKMGKKTSFAIFAGLAILLIIISILAPYLVPNDPYAVNASLAKQPPGGQFPFGTDRLGRCVFSRVLMGARTSIFSAIILLAILFVAGTAIGVIAGFFGGVVDQVIMRIVDIFQAFPQMVLAVAVAGILGGSLVNAMIALGITSWTSFAKLARSQVIAIKDEEYIYAARMSGNSTLRILVHHILPNCYGTLLVNATVQLSSLMMGIAGLSFLGLGVQVPQAEWGSMINEARGVMQIMPWAVFYPSIAMVITIMIFNYLGDACQDMIAQRER